jgi:hypothetical protein
VWLTLVIGVCVGAALQLTVVSGVWFPSRSYPTAKVKLVLYFAQVSDCCFGRLWGWGGWWLGVGVGDEAACPFVQQGK